MKIAIDYASVFKEGNEEMKFKKQCIVEEACLVYCNGSEHAIWHQINLDLNLSSFSYCLYILWVYYVMFISLY